jgi:dienelactone hydrolase
MRLAQIALLAGLAFTLIARAQPPDQIDHANPMLFLDSTGHLQPVKTIKDWEHRRAQILKNMQEVMGPLPDESRKVPLDLKITASADVEGYTRQTITFAVEKGDRLAAYLLIPKNLKTKAPAVLCLHQTTPLGKASPAGLSDRPTLHYAAELARRGYITLAPDYPYFGDNQTDPYKLGYTSATMKGIWNHMRCIDLLQSMNEVDAEKMGCIGHSLGGHNTIFLASFDTRIKAAVSSCGFTSFPKYYGGNLKGWSSDRYMPRINTAYHNDPRQVPFDFPEVIAAIAPRAFFTASPLHDANFEVSGVKDCIAAAQPIYQLLDKPKNLIAIYPDTTHDFGDEARKKAYEFLDQQLKPHE